MFPRILCYTIILLSLTNITFGCGTLWDPDIIELKSDEPASLSTPNYPGVYPIFQHCFWLVDAGENYITSFRVDGAFHVDLAPLSCEGDFVEIHDGALLKTPEIGQYNCMPGTGPRGQSSGRYMLVKFVSDGIDTQQTGFNMLLYRIRSDLAPAQGLHANRPLNIALGVGVPIIIIIVVLVMLLARFYRSRSKKHPHSSKVGGFWAMLCRYKGAKAKSTNVNMPPTATRTTGVENKVPSVKYEIPSVFASSSDKTPDVNNDSNILVSNMEGDHDETRVVVDKV